MRTRFLRGTTTENNDLTLPDGELAIDLETKALRLHDGVTPGGFEITGTQAYTPLVGPGPTTLIAGDTTTGFYGEVTGTELITYGALSTNVGLSAGTLINDAESTWLKFSLDGKVLFISKKRCRNEISWTDIYNIGGVYGTGDTGTFPVNGGVIQDRTVTIGQDTFKVRLLKGAASDPVPNLAYDTYTDPIEVDGSEWNRLLYPVHNIDSAGWATYSDADLEFGTETTPIGSHVQETFETDTTKRITRGIYGYNTLGGVALTTNRVIEGWRPVLELVT